MRRSFFPLLILACLVPSAHSAEPDPEFLKLVPKGAKVEKLAGGMAFTEGPVWMGQYLIFSDIPSERLMKWQKDGGLRVFRKESNAANGNARDHKGRLITCEHKERRVTRTDDPDRAKSDTKPTVLVDRFNGKKFNSPNDAAVRSDGSIWFTDPPYGMGDNDKEQQGNFVYRLDPETLVIRVMIQSMEWPNGICFSPDEKRLYVASSDARDPLVNVFEITGDGTVGGGRVFCKIDNGVPDGIRCDEHGNLWSSAGDGVHVFSRDGKRLGKVEVPEPAANLCFGGEDGKTLFVTARTSLYAVRTNVRGVEPKGRAQ